MARSQLQDLRWPLTAAELKTTSGEEDNRLSGIYQLNPENSMDQLTLKIPINFRGQEEFKNRGMFEGQHHMGCSWGSTCPAASGTVY